MSTEAKLQIQPIHSLLVSGLYMSTALKLNSSEHKL
jgi:hypothetical protein